MPFQRHSDRGFLRAVLRNTRFWRARTRPARLARRAKLRESVFPASDRLRVSAQRSRVEKPLRQASDGNVGPESLPGRDHPQAAPELRRTRAATGAKVRRGHLPQFRAAPWSKDAGNKAPVGLLVRDA